MEIKKIEMRLEDLTKEIFEHLYFVEKKSLGDLAKMCGCSRTAIYDRAKQYGIELRNKSKARRIALDKGKLQWENGTVLSLRNYDKEFFSSWSPGMAWTVGVIYTDGCLNDKEWGTVSISQKEPEILEKIKVLVNTDAKIVTTKQSKLLQNGNANYINSLIFGDQHLFKQLLSLGCTPRKSLTIGFPIIPDEYIRHFIRGCWDGDGSVYICDSGKLGASFVSGSYAMIYGMKKELERAGLPERTIYEDKQNRENSFYSVKFTGKTQLTQLFHYFYDDVPNIMYLQRKYDVFIDAMNKVRNKKKRGRPPKTKSNGINRISSLAVHNLVALKNRKEIKIGSQLKLF